MGTKYRFKYEHNSELSWTIFTSVSFFKLQIMFVNLIQKINAFMTRNSLGANLFISNPRSIDYAANCFKISHISLLHLLLLLFFSYIYLSHHIQSPFRLHLNNYNLLNAFKFTHLSQKSITLPSAHPFVLKVQLVSVNDSFLDLLCVIICLRYLS